MNMSRQNLRLRTELGNMCTHVEIFPRASGGGPKRKRCSSTSPRNGETQKRPGGHNPSTTPTPVDKPPDTPTTYMDNHARKHPWVYPTPRCRMPDRLGVDSKGNNARATADQAHSGLCIRKRGCERVMESLVSRGTDATDGRVRTGEDRVWPKEAPLSW